ncbi:unnamed protein product, partial [Oppiella nova]
NLILYQFHDYSIRHFNGYSVIRLIPETESQLNYLRQLENNALDLDFWRGPSYLGRPVDVMIPPQLNHTFQQKLLCQFFLDFWRGPSYLGRPVDVMIPPQLNHTFQEIFSKKFPQKSLMIDDLEKTLAEERKPFVPINTLDTKADVVDKHFDDYQRLDKIHAFLDAIAAQYPSIAGVETIGTSYEKRNLKIIRIGVNQAAKTKPIIFLEGGIHAREWISSATNQFFAQELVQRSESDADVKDLLNTFDFYILPVLNADGYEYTHTDNRMWRKTRQPNGLCYGTDPNRNFAYQWGGEVSLKQIGYQLGAETYRGPKAFSEPETKAVSDFVLSKGTKVKAYLAVHSYGQYWLYPWGYTSALTKDDAALNRVAKVATTALAQKYNTKYTIGTSTNVLYAAAGGADDWAYGGAGIKYAYTVELRDTGSYGFSLPKAQIRPTGEETTAAFIAFAKEVKKEL